MDIALTDLLTCPRCGPSYGLVVMPGEVRDRRIRTGVLGCANCRERYRLEEWVADLRSGEPGEVGGEAGPGAPEGRSRPDQEAATRLGALLGLGDGGGVVVLTGPAAAQAGLLRELVPGIRVVLVGSGPQRRTMADEERAYGESTDVESASYVRVDSAHPAHPVAQRPGIVPLRDRSVRGVVLDGSWSELLEEGARLLASGGRLVVEPAPTDAVGRLEGAGLRVLLNEAGTIVAGR